MKLYQKLRKKYYKYSKRQSEIVARSYLRKNKDLNDLIDEAKKQSPSVGLSDYEYVKLYQMVRNIKPEYALECGTGKSTFIIAHAMSKNGNGKKLVTMEESEEWANKQRETIAHFLNHQKANTWFPGESKDLIDLIRSPTTITRHRIWSGSCYQTISDYPYSFMMVDGPKHSNESFMNMDLINILKKPDKAISVWIDGRWATVLMCKVLFGDKVICKAGWTHSEIYGARSEDIFKDKALLAREFLKFVKAI